ncbi:MAG: DUF1934 domain-containing protein [Firmicutes bacterium]|nr:DUF1934 domain-containing protein [Bacillota bacterium]
MKDIMLKIVGKQVMKDGKGDSEEQVMEFMTEGQLYERNGSTYLMYKETELSGMEGCTTSLKISGDTVRMKRFGQMLPIDTVMEFKKGKRYEGYYETPYGAVEMEILTNNVDNRLDEGELDIDYAISLKGLTEARSRLNITIVE